MSVIGNRGLTLHHRLECWTLHQRVYMHTLTTCFVDKSPSCSQRFSAVIEVKSSTQITPGCTGGVVDIVLHNPFPEFSWTKGFLSYLMFYGVRHMQYAPQLIIRNCGSDHGDVLKDEAMVWGIRRLATSYYTHYAHTIMTITILPGQWVTCCRHITWFPDDDHYQNEVHTTEYI